MDEASLVLESFYLSGYNFTEIRVLSVNDGQTICTAIEALKKEVENLVVISEKEVIGQAKSTIAKAFSDSNVQNAFDCAAIYSEDTKNLFLLSADGTETGAQYAKRVCIPYIQQRSGMRYDRIVLRAVGANAERVESLMAQAQRIARDSMMFSRVRKYDEDVIEIVYSNKASKMLIDDVLRIFADGFADTLYAMDEASLEEQLVALLKLRRRKISVAESFTGGGIAKRITSVSGASEVYFEGLNTYNEYAKVKRLGVSEYTIRTLGVVSDQTAYEMAYGLLTTGDCDVAVATTGIAGPKSDKSMQPVGLCYIAVGTKEKIRVYRYIFDGNREEITQKAINYALHSAFKQVKEL